MNDYELVSRLPGMDPTVFRFSATENEVLRLAKIIDLACWPRGTSNNIAVIRIDKASVSGRFENAR